MENEIKVNEYIRTKRGIIDRVAKISDNYIFLKSKFFITEYGESSTFIKKTDVVKHSPELLDLIKAEDVIKIKTGLYSSFMHFVVDEDDLIYIKAQMEAGFWIIDKIYTKEMMESISYKVAKM